jgi:HEAT repeat protein
MDPEIAEQIEQFQHPDFQKRWAAIGRLVEIGSPAASALIRALISSHVLMRVCAARTLGELDSVEAIPALRQLQSDPACARVVQTALKRLERLPQPAPEPAPKIPPRPLELGDPDFLTQLREQERRRRLDRQLQIGRWITALGDRRYQERLAAVQALVQIGPDALDALLDALEAPSVLTRTRAADALGKLGLPEAIPRLLDACKNAWEADQQRALQDALLRLAERMAESPAPESLDYCLLLLRERGYTSLSATLFQSVARALGGLAPVNPTPELRRALPLLKGFRPFVPKEFLEARQAIEEATKAWSDLPIASDAPAIDGANLPRPVSRDN